MPPKRASPSSTAGQSGQNKKAKTSTSKAEPKASDRWSAVSASRNTDAHYKLSTSDPARAFAYECICRLPSNDDDDDDDDEDGEDDDSEDDDGEDGNSKLRTKCDGGQTCLCSKPSAEHPDHPWILTYAGSQKLTIQHIHACLRNPDDFDMYTYNDHYGYGLLEVVQNLLVDFDEGNSNWREQWAVCEGMVMFLLGDATEPMMMIDDSEALNTTTLLIGRTFLAMLARLEVEKMLQEGSEVKNLGLIMALYMKLAVELRASDLLEEEDERGAATIKKTKKKVGKDGTFKFKLSQFDDYIVAYANKYGIPLQGLDDIDNMAADCDGTVELPVATKESPDPWGFSDALLKYARDHGTGVRGKKAKIGGDKLDLTSWSSADRKAHSFSGKDPLGKKEIDAIKKGMVMQLG